jgi:LmbE family N-acetylglucosaminyl deacetylase
MANNLDILAIAAHRDDVEQTCGGTLLKMAQRGNRTGILDLTQGEMGTRGTAEERAREAGEAAKILRVSWRQALDIPDGRVENTWENRLKVARVIREQRPRVVILPYWEGRHPDHYTTSKLGYEACFLAGLAKLDVEQALSSQHSAVSQGQVAEHAAPGRPARTSDPTAVGAAVGTNVGPTGRSGRGDTVAASVVTGVGATVTGMDGTVEGHGFSRAERTPETAALAAEALTAHRPFKIIYATLYYDIRPTFVVDITEQFETRFQSLIAYKSQFTDQEAGKDFFPAQADIHARTAAMARFYGMMGGVTYAEPFLQKEVGLVEDLLQIPVKSI